MYRLEYRGTFDAAHRLPNHSGKCANLHGHTWRVRIRILTRRLNAADMVIDFGELKSIVGRMDHRLLNEVISNPTAEVLASALARVVMLKLVMQHTKPEKVSVAVWESQHSMIEFTL